MADLSRATGVSVPMIKFYLREGLLPSGERTSPNQAKYGQEHVRRIMLVRAMADYAGLSIAEIREVLGHLDDPSHGLHDRLGHAQTSITPKREPGDGEEWASAMREAEDLIARHGWGHHPDSPAMRSVAGVLLTLRGLGYTGVLDRLDDYAEAAGMIARADVAGMAQEPNLERMIEIVVVGTSLGDALVAALRRIAQANVSARLFGDDWKVAQWENVDWEDVRRQGGASGGAAPEGDGSGAAAT
ncbi:MerR family transcriptional regulator [Streptosporangium algeriense]|uniref:MerR family transcriptional regulator n=1 Tax=Streptosporangium algeriense TaxID=1682748 RepID=A0ABW3DU39_9ACTN